MRKHLYLVTEHEEDDRVGGIKILDKRLAPSSKNEESDIHKFDEETGEFYTAGKSVSMGYVDFEDEADYEDRIEDEIRRKLGEIDTEWLEKAGLEPQEVLA